jgi:hypothetical protein
MFPLHWSMLWFRLVVMHPWFVPTSCPVKHICSFICILLRDVSRTGPFSSFFLNPSVLGALTVHTLFETSVMHYAVC